ncbi:AlpA family transcriptional regulator [Vibrio vulnificus]|nr:AlpA family transcriptional regulator [Vibrio vulnificus]EHH1183874.1 AlpA family transcriptional regulator [Vibrio vulnificus]EHH2485840.1 AlpA family transcriptional regulator [Vibrio vulnificus]EHI9277229.1 AlpA family transcriptional regulator [Vibrio vulnificus]EHK9115980.1 AlpA family transcriptional regulator [Vibrio vulnificus]
MQLINLKEVIYLTGLKRSSIYKFMEEGHFPKSISIGGRSVMWRLNDIEGWIADRVNSRNLS